MGTIANIPAGLVRTNTGVSFQPSFDRSEEGIDNILSFPTATWPGINLDGDLEGVRDRVRSATRVTIMVTRDAGMWVVFEGRGRSIAIVRDTSEAQVVNMFSVLGMNVTIDNYNENPENETQENN
jgi:hypothetical protein